MLQRKIKKKRKWQETWKRSTEIRTESEKSGKNKFIYSHWDKYFKDIKKMRETERKGALRGQRQ